MEGGVGSGEGVRGGELVWKEDGRGCWEWRGGKRG